MSFRVIFLYGNLPQNRLVSVFLRCKVIGIFCRFIGGIHFHCEYTIGKCIPHWRLDFLEIVGIAAPQKICYHLSILYSINPCRFCYTLGIIDGCLICAGSIRIQLELCSFQAGIPMRFLICAVFINLDNINGCLFITVRHANRIRFGII